MLLNAFAYVWEKVTISSGLFDMLDFKRLLDPLRLPLSHHLMWHQKKVGNDFYIVNSGFRKMRTISDFMKYVLAHNAIKK